MKTTFLIITSIIISTAVFSQSNNVKRKNLTLTPISIEPQTTVKELPVETKKGTEQQKKTAPQKQVADKPKQKR